MTGDGRKKRIAVFTGKRGGFGAMLRIMRGIQGHAALDLKVIASDMHLSSTFGKTIDEVKNQIPVDAVVDLGEYGDAPLDRARAMGRVAERLAPVLADLRPDILLLLGDRGETLAAAMCAAEMGIVIAHIQAGDISGGIDDIHRHAITKLSHLHFSQNESQRQRVIRLGESSDRVWNTGAPYIDNIVHGGFPSTTEALQALNLDLDLGYFIVLQHSDTYRPHLGYEHTRAILKALSRRSEPSIVIYPCSDPGYQGVIRAIEEFNGHRQFHVFRSIEAMNFIGIMNGAKALVGNSSAGIIEAPYLHLPFVNVGLRQDGREMCSNVISCNGTEDEISAAIEKSDSPTFRARLATDDKPFGDGHASERILKVLSETTITPELFRKRITY